MIWKISIIDYHNGDEVSIKKQNNDQYTEWRITK